MFSLQKIMFKLLVILFIAKYITASFNYYQLSKFVVSVLFSIKAARNSGLELRKKYFFVKKKTDNNVVYCAHSASTIAI